MQFVERYDLEPQCIAVISPRQAEVGDGTRCISEGRARSAGVEILDDFDGRTHEGINERETTTPFHIGHFSARLDAVGDQGSEVGVELRHKNAESQPAMVAGAPAGRQRP
jgi:hypothetical protein